MIYYAVIDTNVIVSAMLNPDSIPGAILKYALVGVVVPLMNDEITEEYERVISRDKFSFDKEDIKYVLAKLLENAVFVDRVQATDHFIDKKDIVFYEIVLGGKTTFNSSYLVTGNIKHFPNKPFVVTPREMFDIINSSQ